MIINKNSSNTIIVTLNEFQIVDGSDWLLELTNDMTSQVSVFSIVDISQYPLRYNEFVIIDPTDIDLKPGTYTYRVLEMAASSPVDMVAANTLGSCESGICDIIGNDPITYYEVDENEIKGTFDE